MTQLRSDLKHLIDKAAYSVYRRYRGYVVAEDVRQEMWLWALQIPKNMLEAMDTVKLRWKLKDAGEAYARREKAVKSGYSPDDEIFYGQAVIRELLPEAIADEPLTLKGIHERAGGKPARGTGTVFEYETAVADIRTAFAALSTVDQDVILAWAANEFNNEMDVTSVIRRLQRKLGGKRPKKHLEMEVEPVVHGEG